MLKLLASLRLPLSKYIIMITFILINAQLHNTKNDDKVTEHVLAVLHYWIMLLLNLSLAALDIFLTLIRNERCCLEDHCGLLKKIVWECALQRLEFQSLPWSHPSWLMTRPLKAYYTFTIIVEFVSALVCLLQRCVVKVTWKYAMIENAYYHYI